MTHFALGAVDWSQLSRELGSTALQGAAEAAVAVPAVQVNRARIASLVHLGYQTVDTYEAARPWLFLASVAGVIGSGIGMSRRRKIPEAVALYSITGVLSLAMGIITRPRALGAQAPTPPATNANAPGALRSTLAWTDGRVARLSREDPGWESRTLARLWGDVGSGTMAPVVSTLLTRNSR